MTIKALLFDLDGTVLNTNELILQTFEYSIEKVLGIVPSRKQLKSMFGEPLYDTMAHFDANRAQELVDVYREYNMKVHDELTTIFPTVADTLAALNEKGYRLAIVTSKKNYVALHGLKTFGLDQYFHCFVGHDDTEEHKPHPAPALKALEMLNIPPEQAIMVGDSPYDILCGKNAGTKTVLVSYTFHELEKMKTYQPDYIIDELQELLAIVEKE